MEPVAVGDIALGDGDEAGQAGLGSQKVVVGRIETAGALGVREAIADGEDLALPVVEEGEAHAVDESEGARGELLEARREPTGLRGRGRQPRGEGPRPGPGARPRNCRCPRWRRSWGAAVPGFSCRTN